MNIERHIVPAVKSSSVWKKGKKNEKLIAAAAVSTANRVDMEVGTLKWQFSVFCSVRLYEVLLYSQCVACCYLVRLAWKKSKALLIRTPHSPNSEQNYPFKVVWRHLVWLSHKVSMYKNSQHCIKPSVQVFLVTDHDEFRWWTCVISRDCRRQQPALNNSIIVQ